MVWSKITKSASALLMALTVVGVTPVAAEDTKETTTKYKVAEGYEWDIHTEVDFGKDKGVNQTSTVDKSYGVNVSKNVIGDGKILTISLDADNDFQVVNGSTSLSYTVAKDGETDKLGAGSEVLAVPSGTNTGSQDLEFVLSTSKGEAEVAGKYSDTIKYVAAIVDAPVTFDLTEWRNTYESKDLGTSITSDQLAEIKSGELSTISLGSYWTLDGTVYRVSDYDYYYDGSSVTDHDLVLVPDTALTTMKMNSSDTNETGYYGSAGRATLQSTVKSALPSVLREHLLTHNMYMSTATNSSSPYANTWELKESNGIELMSVAQVYPSGYKSMSSSIIGWGNTSTGISSYGFDSYSTDKQISLFKFASNGTVLDVADYKTTKADNVAKDYWWWLASSASSVSFARVNYASYVSVDGYSLGGSGAALADSVRPAITIKG